MDWWHRLIYKLTHPQRWMQSQKKHFWSGISILVFQENSAEPPRRIRLNYIMLVLSALLLIGLPLINLGVTALERGKSHQESQSLQTRVILAYNMHDNLKLKRSHLARIASQLTRFRGLFDHQSLFYFRDVFSGQSGQEGSETPRQLGQKYYNLELLEHLRQQARYLLDENAYHSLHFLWHRVTLYSLTPRGRPLNAGAGMISSGFGYRENPTAQVKSREFHTGVDFADAPGTPLTATAAGYAFRAVTDPNTGYGKHVRLHHGFGFTTLYAHCRDLAIEKGEYVRRGQVVGYLGKTGRVTGHHVHYEVQFGNEPSVNPMEYVQLR